MGPLLFGIASLIHSLSLLLGLIAVCFVLVMGMLVVLIAWKRQQTKERTLQAMRAYDGFWEEE